MTPDLPSPDERAKHVWSLGSYTDIAPNFLGIAAHLVERADVRAGADVLDVACGTGNAAITAARRGATVTGLDLVPAMLDEARENATIADVDVDWLEGTATDLPSDDDAFDVTLSCLGHVFAEPVEDAGRELVRVTRPGGRVAFASWTPEGPVPAMGDVLQGYLPQDPDPSDPPFLWGDTDVVRERLGDDVAAIEFETGTAWTPAQSPEHYWQKAITESGMFIAALTAVDEADRPALREEAVEAIDRFFDGARNAVPMEYRLATATVD